MADRQSGAASDPGKSEHLPSPAIGMALGLVPGFFIGLGIGREWLSLALLLAVFLLHHIDGFVSAVHPHLAAETGWLVSRAAAGAFLSGLVIARSWRWRKALAAATQ